MIRYLPCIMLILFLSVPAHAQNVPSEHIYEGLLSGRTQDDLLTYFGAPSHRITLEDGTKIFEYNARILHTPYVGPREILSCTTRLWFKENKVFHADGIGDDAVCMHFLKTRLRTDTIRDKDWPKASP